MRAGQIRTGASIRGFMPDQHREFFGLLPYVFVATADESGWPLATMLGARSGFIHSSDPVTLRFDTTAASSDPIIPSLIAGQDIGILGIDLSTRRRNRANGHIAHIDDAGFTVKIHQSFGNCAKYIQRREAHPTRRTSGGLEAFYSLDSAARAQISKADTIFVASRSRAGLSHHAGMDMSHRGGRPGFIRTVGNILMVPDFGGNRYYNTLGNFLGEPRGSVLLIDFDSGDLLQLQGLVTIHWNDQVELEGAERWWSFEVTSGWRRRGACPFEWSFIDYSPATLRTGIWAQL